MSAFDGSKAGRTLLKFQDILIIQKPKRGVTAQKRLKFL